MVSYLDQMLVLRKALHKKNKELDALKMCKSKTMHEKNKNILFQNMLLSTKRRWEKRLRDLEIEKKRKVAVYPQKHRQIKETYLPYV